MTLSNASRSYRAAFCAGIPASRFSGPINPLNETTRPDLHTSQLMFVLCIITSSGFQRVINTILLASLNTFVPWVQSRALNAIAWIRFRLCLRLRFRGPYASQISNSECSSLEEQMPGRLRFCRESATQQRVQRSTGLVRRVLAIRYVLIPNGAFNLIVYTG